MSEDSWLTLAVLAVTIALLMAERIPAALTVIGAVTFLLVLGVIDEKEAFAGFSNPAPLTVAALYVLAGAVELTGALDWISEAILGRRPPPGSAAAKRRELVRLLLPSAAISAFVNNTPIVAMAAPRVLQWTRRTGRSASHYLMPLSFGVILGGLVTTIGTSTNILVSGLLQDAGHRPLGLFEVTRLGLPVAAIGLIVLIAIGPILAPKRPSPGEQLRTRAKEFTVEMLIENGSQLAGRTVAAAGLRNLQGVYLVEIERGERTIAPVSPDEVLVEGDRLTFAGNVGNILDLVRIRGLAPSETRHFSLESDGVRRFFEVVIAPDSALIGSTLKQVGFRRHYDGAVLAIHRSGEQIRAKLGEVPLRGGDVLLVLAEQGFAQRWSDQRDFLIVSAVEGGLHLRKEKALLVQFAFLALIITTGTGLLSMLEASLLAAGAVVVFGALTPRQAQDSVDLNVILLMAASFGLGAAITNSGLAQVLAGMITNSSAIFGGIGILGGVLLATTLLTALISNSAAAILMFPIALATAAEAGLHQRPFAIAVMLGASIDFLTPFGYQTNTIVYGMGGYRFGDFARLGAPLTITTILTAILAIPLGWPLHRT